VRVGDRVLVSGTAPIWPDGSCDPDPEAQARRCIEIIGTALGEAGARPEQVARTRIFLTDAEHGFAPAGPRYNRAASELHWERVHSLLRRNL